MTAQTTAEGWATQAPNFNQYGTLCMTSSQQHEIIRLLNNPVIGKAEKIKMLLGMGDFSRDRANQAIANITAAITARESRRVAA